MKTNDNESLFKITTLSEIVGENLMNLRKKRKLTLNDLAQKSKVSTSTISRYENGKSSMSLDTIDKILICLDTTPIIFFNNCFAKMQRDLK